MRVVLAVAAVVLVGCSQPVPMVQLPTAPPVATVSASPTPSVAVLGVKVAKPSPKPVVKAKPAPKPKPKPVHHKAKPKPKKAKQSTATDCYVGVPCDLSHLHWTVTYGCTVAWRKATHLPCPPGQPPIP